MATRDLVMTVETQDGKVVDYGGDEIVRVIHMERSTGQIDEQEIRLSQMLAAVIEVAHTRHMTEHVMRAIEAARRAE